jgi:hypothetical protein
MGIAPERLCVMGYEGGMGYVWQIPVNQLGNLKILWVITKYGLSGLWVRRGSTVAFSMGRNSTTAIIADLNMLLNL